MKITEVYKKYRINKGLQEHMIRVAAVAKQICDSSTVELDAETIVSACLLHDMGNLIKFKLEIDLALLEPEGIEYWRQIQQEFVTTYGSDVHEATTLIIKDCGADEKVLRTVDEASFDGIAEVAKVGSIGAKVLEYADMRVGLNNIITLEERFEDIKNRYVPQRFTLEVVEEKYQAAQSIEQEIFTKSHIRPEDITDESTADIQTELWDFDLKTQ